MKRLLLSSILVILNLIIINKTAADTDYNGLIFELPISYSEAKSAFNLDSNHFLRTPYPDNRDVLLHSGSSEEIIGVTFYKKFESSKQLEEGHKKAYAELEEIYKKRFKAFDFSFFTSINGKYYSMALENGLTIVLGDVMYNLASNNYVTVSFFQDVPEKEMRSFLYNIY